MTEQQMASRTLFEAEHDDFRASFRQFVVSEIVPRYEEWSANGRVDRDVWAAAARLGFVGMGVPEEYGGAGCDDFRFNVVVTEELARAGVAPVGFPLQSDITLPYLLGLADDEQRQRWLPGIAAGETITAIAITEPAAGSDMAGIRTTAKRDGDYYVLDGAKTFITNGQNADLVIVAARTDPAQGTNGFSLLVVERGMEGFARGRHLEKIGMHANDTSELFFDAVHVPRANLLGEEGGGFRALMSNLVQERLSISVTAMAVTERALEDTLDYVRQRTAFGRPVGTFQHSRFLLAELHTEATIGRVFLDDCIAQHLTGALTPERAAMAKWWTTELQLKVIDRCLQLHGGYGYMLEVPIARAFIDSRAQTIYGGSTEIMKEIIGRSLGLGDPSRRKS